VDLVGYSAGGVVVRLWASEGHNARHARRIVTLGAPSHGTEVAGAAGLLVGGGCGGACAQLAPDSALLDRLNDGDETPNGPVWVSIWTDADHTVVPPDSARLDGADNITVQGVCTSDSVSHSQEPRDPVVIGLVFRALGTGSAPHPSAADCAALRRVGS
jgi:triacylglycerol esterase/lipase EstA (alpha/beta hydrolase family)